MADSTQNAVEERRALREYLDAAREFARIGGKVSLGWFRADALEVERKADDSPVTVADRRTEEAMREAILRRFPDHRIVGEEFGGELGAHRYQWVIDPIDGTKTFVRGVPLYTTLVALVIDGNPAVGVIYCPPTGEMASAALGCGAWDERGRRMHVSDTARLEDAWFFSTDPADLLRRHPEWGHALLTRSAAVRTWADAYGYLLLARGDADLMFD
ncbi:MAG: hypothetical protein MI724_14215, partial [Spirochaetales bacterium]|nr:hypothetical protein [Spirochaetales bacterium]